MLDKFARSMGGNCIEERDRKDREARYSTKRGRCVYLRAINRTENGRVRELERRLLLTRDNVTGRLIFVIEDGYDVTNQKERKFEFKFPEGLEDHHFLEIQEATDDESWALTTPKLECSVVHLDEQGRISPTSSISSVSSFIFNDNTLRSEALGSPILDRNAKRTSKTLTAACMLTGIVLLAAFVLSTIVLIPNAIPGTEGLRDTVTHTHIGYCIAIGLIVVMLAMGLGLTSIGTRRFFHSTQKNLE